MRLLPGAARLIAHLHAHGVPIAIATGSNRAEFALKTAHMPDTFALFGDKVVCADDALMHGRKSKPAPDVFLQAAKLLGRTEADGPKGLVFEDAIPGVQAAVAAGMQGACFFVPPPADQPRIPVAIIETPPNAFAQSCYRCLSHG